MVSYILSFIFISFVYCGARRKNGEIPQKRKITSLEEEYFYDLKIYYDRKTFDVVMNSLTISESCKVMLNNSIKFK